ncbi:hypothetical protein MRX96_033683 [Rhipicephalus microplus]
MRRLEHRSAPHGGVTSADSACWRARLSRSGSRKTARGRGKTKNGLADDKQSSAACELERLQGDRLALVAVNGTTSDTRVDRSVTIKRARRRARPEDRGGQPRCALQKPRVGVKASSPYGYRA